MRSAGQRNRESVPALALIVLLAIMLAIVSYLVAANSRSVEYNPPSLTNQ